MNIDSIGANIPTEHHRKALEWFMSNAGKEVPWQNRLQDGTLLFTTAKGIFKPKDTNYALSVKQTIGEIYPDQDPILRNDGTWTYRYHQEEQDAKKSIDLFTNRGLLACMQDNVPVGVARQTRPKPDTTYHILGVAKVSGYKDGFFQLDGYSPTGKLFSQPIDGPFSDLLQGGECNRNSEPFDPNSKQDAREKVLQEVTRRRGQGKFRAALLRIYGGVCAITGCKVTAILEAAHVTPYLGPDTNESGNGILLRSDIHTLWDLGLVAINPDNYEFWVSPTLAGSEYEMFLGKAAFQPTMKADRPSSAALKAQWEIAFCSLQQSKVSANA
jgi:hypothetical protein